MKIKLGKPPICLKVTILFFFIVLAPAFVNNCFGQLAFSNTWPLVPDQSFAITGPGAVAVTATNQVMSSTLFLPVSGAYSGNPSGNGQRCSPKLDDGNDGGWNSDAGAVEGRYMEFEVNPTGSYDMKVSSISFSIGNRSSSEIDGSVYYYVGASNAGFTIATGTALGIGLGSNVTNSYTVYNYATNISVPNGSKIFLRIYPYNEGSNTTGKYCCVRSVVISGTTTSPNITAISFTTPATCLTDRLNVSWTGPYGFNAATNTLLAFIKPGSAVNAGSPAATLASYSAVSTVYGMGQVYENDAAATCIYKATGTDALGNHSGLSISGLLPNTTYYLLIFKVINATNVYSAGATGNGTTLATPVAEPANHPSSFVKTSVSTSNISLAWIAATAGLQAPLGYLVKASNSTLPVDPGFSSPPDGTDIPDQPNFISGLANAKVTPNSTTAYGGFTGFAPGTMYYFRINSYTNTGACINYKSGGPTINVATLPNAVSSPSLNVVAANDTLAWTAAAAYNGIIHTTLVFIKASASVITPGTPTANPSIYSASADINIPGSDYELDANAKCIYKGDGTSVILTNLAAGTTYQILILTVVDAPNYDGANSYSAYTALSVTTGYTYTWTGASATPTDWATPGNWSPNRVTPLANDILVFNSGGTITPTALVSQTIAQLQITGNTNLIYKSTVANITLSITGNNGALFNDFIIASGSAFTLDRTSSFTTVVTLTNNITAGISGTLTVNAGCAYLTTAAGNFTTVAGTLKNSGAVGSSAGNMVVTATGTYECAANGGSNAIAFATWLTGSTCLVSGITNAASMDGHRQTFSKFIWDCPLQTSTFNLGSATTSPGSIPPIFEAIDSFIIKRTNTGLLLLTAPTSQRDVYCGNYIQYGGNVAITGNTSDNGGQRSLFVANSFYVTDSLENNAQFLIVANSTGINTYSRLLVGGSVVMRLKPVFPSTVTLAKTGSGVFAELWFTGITNQYAKFSTITAGINFVTAQNVAGFNVSLGSDARAGHFKLSVGNFIIGSNTLSIDSTVSYPSPGTGTISGSSASNLTMGLNGAAGTLVFASGSRILKDFTQLTGNAVSLGTPLAITAGAAPGRDSLGANAVFTTNDFLTLRSDANGTARVAQLPSTAVISGKVTVERYLPMNLTSAARRWRLLTAPFKPATGPTINAGWQAGGSTSNLAAPVNLRPGYGTQITKSITWSADGYDIGTTGSPSIYYYSNALNGWQAPATTNSVKITDNSGCYMLFARGGRNIPVGNSYVPAAPTTLDPKGDLNIGDVTIPMLASGYQTVGNPYASEILLDNIEFNDTLGKSRTVYLWDPKTSGSYSVGKFITCSGNGDGTYIYSANTSGFDSRPGVIESSGAFMIQCNSGGTGNIVFHESDKTTQNSTIGIASRPATRTGSFGKISKLYTDLYVINNDMPALADGVVNAYNKNYENAMDHFDAVKLTSFNSKEELSIRKEGQFFAIERRKKIAKEDTIFLNISKLNPVSYQFVLRPVDFTDNCSAFLKDNFLGTLTEFSLRQNSIISFSITEDPASAATDRFYIIFKKPGAAKTIPLTAAVHYPDIALQWYRNNNGGQSLFIERSSDGEHFTTINTFKGAESGTKRTDWLDKDPLPGQYWYRIRYEDEDGQTAYSNIAKAVKITAGITPVVSPNPVRNGQIGLQMPEGVYNIKLINSSGQALYTSKIVYQNSREAKIIDVKNTGASGMCTLKITSNNKAIAALKIIVQ